MEKERRRFEKEIQKKWQGVLKHGEENKRGPFPMLIT